MQHPFLELFESEDFDVKLPINNIKHLVSPLYCFIDLVLFRAVQNRVSCHMGTSFVLVLLRTSYKLMQLYLYAIRYQDMSHDHYVTLILIGSNRLEGKARTRNINNSDGGSGKCHLRTATGHLQISLDIYDFTKFFYVTSIELLHRSCLCIQQIKARLQVSPKIVSTNV